MNNALLQIHQDLLVEMFAQGNEMSAAKVTEGLPKGAKVVSSWYDPDAHIIKIILEHESFNAPKYGRLPDVEVMVTRIDK